MHTSNVTSLPSPALDAILCRAMLSPSSLVAHATSFKAGLTVRTFHTITSVELEKE
jgi:hypothetical protein